MLCSSLVRASFSRIISGTSILSPRFFTSDTRPKQAPFRLTPPPCPDWKLGDGATDTGGWKEGEQSRKTWDLETTPPRDAYRLLTSAIVPRPIAFVSSLSTDGTPNLAPFSYFSMVSHNPPLVSISFSLSPRRPKDTRENILETGEFTVSIISESFVEAANATSVESPASVDEWILSGLSMEASTDVKPPFVKESAVSFECSLYHSQNITPPESTEITATLILGLIKRVHVRGSVLSEDGDAVDPGKLRPVARLGGNSYARLVEGFDLPRLSWKATRNNYAAIQECVR